MSGAFLKRHEGRIVTLVISTVARIIKVAPGSWNLSRRGPLRLVRKIASCRPKPCCPSVSAGLVWAKLGIAGRDTHKRQKILLRLFDVTDRTAKLILG